MKVLKKATQKNVILNKGFYNDFEIKQMLELKEICFFDDDLNEIYDSMEYVKNFYEPVLRLFLVDGDEIKVIVNDGFYTNVLIKTNGKKYFINL